jgi:NAD(P)H-hydrate epimerase
MKIFDTKDIREIDAYTIGHEPVSSVNLMERAASGCAAWIAENIAAGVTIKIFTGPGNNGGDGWAIARILVDKGFHQVELFHLQISQIISQDAEINRERLISQGKTSIHYIRAAHDFPMLHPSDIVVDALFGSGLTRTLEGLPANLVKHINQSGCRVISIDIPSGLFGEDNTDNPEHGTIHASDTLTFQFPKRSFFFAENEKHTGKWHIIPIGLHPDILEEKQTAYYYASTDLLINKLKRRKVFSHKGTYGHALLVAGSYGMLGAAILAARSCLRTGVGLLTTHVPRLGYPIVQTAVPESIFSIDPNDSCFAQSISTASFTAVAVGPGIGTSVETASAVEKMLKQCNKPLLLDADALNILSTHPQMIGLLPENTIITPHPGEFDRLAGVSASGFKRNQLQISFSKKHKIIVILKGAYSSITLPDGSCYYNSTGNPGMATAGSGDVLTGMVLSLLAQGYPSDEAALLGTYIHGYSGDLAAVDISEQSMIASDIIDHIGNAFNKIQSS